MSKLDWDEVKQLAADFQRAQLNTSLQKLSDRNVIEIVTKLIEQKLISLYFTNDGKEYITPEQLRQEIIDETYLAKGRINLVDLANILNVNLSIVQVQCNDIVKHEKDYLIILGQLIHKDYLKKIATEINELLKKNGHVTVEELTKTYNLPGDFMQSVIESNLNILIKNVLQSKSNSRLFYTESFINRNKCAIRGALLAINKPTQLIHIVKLVSVDLNVFNIIIDQLINDKQIGGQLTNRNSLNNCLYIPFNYIKEQNEYIENFYRINNYLEYDNLKRYNINEPVGFIKKHFVDRIDKIVFLNSCCINDIIIEQVIGSVEEAIDSDGIIDVSNIVPTIFNDNDVEDIVKYLFNKKNINKNNDLYIYLNMIIVSESFINKIKKVFKEVIIKEKSEIFVKNGDYVKYLLKNSKVNHSKDDGEENVDKNMNKKEERRKKAASGKLGGGSQGRETKTKSIKKKNVKTQNIESDDEEEKDDKLIIITKKDIQEVIDKESLLNDVDLTDPDAFINEIVNQLLPDFNKLALKLCNEIYESSLQNNSDKRKLFNQFESKMLSIYYDIILYNKTLRLFDSDLKLQLSKHLLKTLCNENMNIIIIYLSKNEFEENPEISIDQRNKLINQITNQDLIKKINNLIKSNTIDDYLLNLEIVFQSIDIYIKKLDKKKEKQIILNHKYILIDQLKQTENNNYAIILHLTVLILFTIIHEHILLASGKFVYSILLNLKSHLNDTIYDQLIKYHDHVVKLFTFVENNDKIEEEKQIVLNYLNDQADSVKQIAVQYKHANKEREK